MTVNKKARIIVRNKFDFAMRVQVLHQYTGETTEDSGWHTIEPSDQHHVMDVQYYTGILTVGRDNFIVNATELNVIKGQSTSGLFNMNGQAIVGIKRYQSGHGLLAQWKSHTLRDSDKYQDTFIDIRPGIIEFLSNSGKSTTTFDLEFVPHVV